MSKPTEEPGSSGSQEADGGDADAEVWALLLGDAFSLVSRARCVAADVDAWRSRPPNKHHLQPYPLPPEQQQWERLASTGCPDFMLMQRAVHSFVDAHIAPHLPFHLRGGTAAAAAPTPSQQQHHDGDQKQQQHQQHLELQQQQQQQSLAPPGAQHQQEQPGGGGGGGCAPPLKGIFGCAAACGTGGAAEDAAGGGGMVAQAATRGPPV